MSSVVISIYKKLLFSILIVLCVLPNLASAQCSFDTPNHQICEYFAQTRIQARSLCAEKVSELVVQGYRSLNCTKGLNGITRIDAGNFTEDADGNRKFPFQFIRVFFNIDCEDGSLVDPDTGVCVPIDPDYEPDRDEPGKDSGCTGDNGVGNPCNVATGNKSQIETDILNGALSFVRTYNSDNLADIGLGRGWRSVYQKGLTLSGDTLVQVSSTGRGEPWRREAGNWVGDADSDISITEDASGFTLTKSNGDVEQYDISGKLISQTDTQGRTTSYTYNSNNQPFIITNHYGQSLVFAYNLNRHLISVTDATGAKYKYEYDENYNLIEVIYPDLTSNDDQDNPRRIYHYENSNYVNHLTGISDENGDRFATYIYDDNGKAIATEHAVTTNSIGQEHFSLAYTNPTETMVSDAVGTDVLWSYDEILDAKKLTSKVNQVDSKGIFQSWDANGNMLSRTDEEGRTTAYTYNATNQRLTLTEAVGTPQERVTSYEYVNADIDLITKTISPSISVNKLKEVTNTYDNNLNITAVTTNGFDAQGAAVSRSTTFAYDTYGKVISIDGPRTDVSDITSLEYYDCTTGAQCGQLKKVTNALGHVTTYDSYDSAARLLQSTNANNVVTTYTYHPRGWLLSMTQTAPTGAARVTTYEYDSVGQMTKTTLPDGTEQNYVYDAAQDLREVFDNLGNKIEYTYDAKGNRTDELLKDPDGTLVRSTITSYDIRNFIESINSGGSVTQLINDAVGNLSTQTDPNLNPTTDHSFDALDRLSSTIDALSNTSSYNYDVADQLSQVTAPNGAITQYEYDDLGNQTKEISADRGTITYSHDDAGNVIGMTDARGITATYSYDALNRLTNISYPDGSENITYKYDVGSVGLECYSQNVAFALGRLCQIVDAAGQTNYQYDAWGNVTQLTRSILGKSYVWQYFYDDANRVTKIIYPNNRLVSYVRDAIGRIVDVNTLVNNQITTIVSGRQYRGDGLRLEHLFSNGLYDTRQYDLQGRLVQQVTADSSLRYFSHDANGNINDIVDTKGTRDFDYDVLDRLENQSLNTNISSYQYDENGNRTQKDKTGEAQSQYTYEAATNRLLNIGGSNINLDASGNILSDQGGSRVFEYNQRGRLKRVLMNGAEVAHYEYDANSLRVKKVTTERTTVYHYGLDGRLLAESLPTGEIERQYLYADGELLAMIVFDAAPVATDSCSSTANIAVDGTASQSSTHRSEVASKAINGIFTDSAHTTTSDTNASWQLDYIEDRVFTSVLIHNRAITRHWLRDLLISVEDANGVQVYESGLINPENVLDSPANIQVNLPAQTIGKRLKIRRIHDTDLSGGGSSSHEGFILTMAEVEIEGCVAPQPPTAPTVVTPEAQVIYQGATYSYQIDASDLNGDDLTYLATGLPSGLTIDFQTGLITGTPLIAADNVVSVTVSDGVLSSSVSFDINVVDSLCSATANIAVDGTASQSSTHRSEVASKAINGIFTDSAHTTTSDTNASWQLDYTEDRVFTSVLIYNRAITRHWLRDLLISVEDANSVQVYESGLINPENVLDSPANIQINLPALTIGKRLKIRRIHDTDLSGGGSSSHEGFILTMAEVEIEGCLAPQGGQ